TNEVLNALEVTEKLELTETDGKCADGLVKDGAVENVEESLTSELINQEAKDSEVTKTTPDVSLIVGQDDDNIKQEVCEKIESEAVKESEVNNDKIELDHEVAPEVVKESEIEPRVEGIVDEIKIEKIESDRELVPEEVSETDKKVSVSIEKEDLGEHIQEVVNKLDTQCPEEVSETELYVLVLNALSGPKIEKKTSIDGSDGLRASISGSEEFFSDAVTEFSDSGTSQGGSVKKSLEDLFYSFSDGENGEAKKSTLGEAESPSAKKTDHAAKKDEAVNYKEGIEDGKKGQKKVKRVRPCVPFLNHQVLKKDHEAKKDEAVNNKEGDPMSPLKLIEDGDEGRKVHLCTKCGWPFSNPYPSPKHRRSHKKHCGTIEGQKIEKKTSIGGSDGLRASISGSEDEFLSDGSVKESLDKDLFYTFSDSKNGDEVVNYKEGVEDGKKGRKKVKRDRPWVPFVCCSAESPSAKKINHAAKKEAVNDKEGIEDDHVAKKDEAVNDKEGDPMSPPKLIEDGKKGRKKLKGVSSWVLFCSSLDVVDSKVMRIQ
ncbi:putative transcription factor C2H2 family protein, partial [Tanacetum coccineum]